jgi:hypothetical protein
LKIPMHSKSMISLKRPAWSLIGGSAFNLCYTRWE